MKKTYSFKEYCNLLQKFKSAQRSAQMGHSGEALEAQNLIENAEINSTELVNLLNGGNFNKIKALEMLGVDSKEITKIIDSDKDSITRRDELEKLLIKTVGIDRVIEAGNKVKERNPQAVQGYGNSLAALRHERGFELLSEDVYMAGASTPEEVKEYMSKHPLMYSEYAIEDAVSSMKISKTLSKENVRKSYI